MLKLTCKMLKCSLEYRLQYNSALMVPVYTLPVLCTLILLIPSQMLGFEHSVDNMLFGPTPVQPGGTYVCDY